MDGKFVPELVQALFLLIFAAVGWIIAREDLAAGKISNKRLARGLVVCLAGYGLQAAFSLAGRFGFAERFLLPGFYTGAAMHAAISLAAALALWFFEIWPAGDAKFFVVCAIFAPLVSPGLRAFPRYLSLEILVNIFTLSAFYVLAHAVVSPGRVSEKPNFAAAAARWREFLIQGLNTAGLFLARTASRPFLEDVFPAWATSPIAVYLLLFVFWDRLRRFTSNKFLAVVSAAGVLAVAALGLLRPSWRPLAGLFFAQWAGFGVFFGAARGALEFYFTRRACRTIAAREVLPGAILSEKSLSLLKRDREYFREHFTPVFRDGLSPSQSEALKQWLMGFPQERRFIEVLQAHPFGVWIFAGTLFTLAARRDAVSLALSWFQ